METKKAQKLPEWRLSFRGTPLWLSLFFYCLAAGILIPGCLSSGSALESGLIPGIYEGIGRGYRGPVHVQVQVSSSGIEDIVITSHKEGTFPGGTAMEELLEAVLEYGSTDLDAISGATFSSRGFLEAVEDALGQARGKTL